MAFCIVLILSCLLLNSPGVIAEHHQEGNFRRGRAELLSGVSILPRPSSSDNIRENRVQSVQERTTFRHLQQTDVDEPDNQDVQCRLADSEISDLFDGSRTWLVDQVALENVANDLNAILPCTRENDVVLFQTERKTRLASTAYVPWNLTLSSFVERADNRDGIFPETDQKVRFRCPRNGSAFRIRARNVLLSNLVFEECTLGTRTAASIIQVDPCDSEDIEGIIRMHHVHFRQNALNGTSAVSVGNASCSSVEMVDVVFSDNACGDACFAVLSSENTLQAVVAERNTRLTGESTMPASLIVASSLSTSAVVGLTANANELSVLRIVEGNLDLLDSRFRENNGDPAIVLDHSLTVAISNSAFHNNSAHRLGASIQSNSTEHLSISNCSFVSNAAEIGGAIASADTVLAIDHCAFHDNLARSNGGSIITEGGSFEMEASLFENNSASNAGGAIHIRNISSPRLTAFRCHNNTSGSGGCLWVSESERLILRRSALVNNTAINGGAFFLDTVSDSHIVGVRIESNTATSYGGGFQSRASGDLSIRRCLFLSNVATSNGAGAQITENSSVVIQAVSWTANAAGGKGGGIYASASNVTSRFCNYTSNNAGAGGGIAIYSGTARIASNTFLNNSGTEVGGGIRATGQSRLVLKDTYVTLNKAGVGGGVYLDEGIHVVRSTRFDNNSATQYGGGLACLVSNATLTDLEFASNTAVFAGGAIHIAIVASIVARNLTIVGNRCDRAGGGIVVDQQCVFNLSNSILQRNDAEDGGGLYLRNSVVHLKDCRLQSNTAAKDGGGLFIFGTDRTIVEDSMLSSNLADKGGAVRCVEGELVTRGVTFSINTASDEGGSLSADRGGVMNLYNTSIIGSRSKQGGALYAESNSSITLQGSVIRNNSAIEDGGAILAKNSVITVTTCRFRENSGSSGGSIMMKNSTLRALETVFENDRASLSGGSIAAKDNDSLSIVDTSFLNCSASTGGAIWLSESNLTASKLRSHMCRAITDGGGILANETSVFLCSDCSLNDNTAGNRGGSVAFDSGEAQSLAMQFNNCTFASNSADLGGGVYVSTDETSQGCSRRNASCTFFAVMGSRFSRNAAKTSGGGIFTKDPTVFRYSCSPEDTETPPAQNPIDATKRLISAHDTCPEWVENEAGQYGPMIASCAHSARGLMIAGDETDDEELVKNTSFVVKNHRSGDVLPALLLEVVDGFRQGPPLGSNEAYVHASMHSPDNFFAGEVIMAVNERRKAFPPISGFQRPGQYEIRIDFSESDLPPLVVDVEVRRCKMGECAQENGTLCVPCSGSQFNFDPDASVCRSCPENGNCTTNVIHPIRRYWHKTPCAKHIQRCVSREGCDFDGREEDLMDVTQDLHDCQMDEQLNEKYSQAQCKKGYTGVLCGSCETGYGRSRSFDCDKCRDKWETVVLFVLSVLVLLFLSGFAIRSNLTTRQIDLNLISRISPKPQQSSKRQMDGESNEVPVNFEMVEMLHSGHVPPEVIDPNLRTPSPTNRQSSIDPTLARRHVVEIFKIMINFLQVIAAAVMINTNWTAWMRSFLLVADFLGGAATQGIVLSVDCLFGVDYDPPRSVIRSAIFITVPLGILAFYSVLWIILMRKFNESIWYFGKRALLSSLAVAYLTYLSVTKMAVNTLYCIEVHDSYDTDIDHTSHYWAVDTSLKCFRGSHAVLAAVVGWPVVIVVSFGLPTGLAYALMKLHPTETNDNHWITEACGFLFRAYKERFIFWESTVMLRKALLAIVVVFSYPLGTNIQSILAIFVLASSVYMHVSCQPFKEDFDFLNAYETASLIISQLTFASGVLFNDSRLSDAVRVLLTVSLSLAISGLFCLLMFKIFRSIEIYARAVLVCDGVDAAIDWGMYRVLRIYSTRVIARFCAKLAGKRDRNPPNPQTQPGSSSQV